MIIANNIVVNIDCALFMVLLSVSWLPQIELNSLSLIWYKQDHLRGMRTEQQKFLEFHKVWKLAVIIDFWVYLRNWFVQTVGCASESCLANFQKHDCSFFHQNGTCNSIKGLLVLLTNNNRSKVLTHYKSSKRFFQLTVSAFSRREVSCFRIEVPKVGLVGGTFCLACHEYVGERRRTWSRTSRRSLGQRQPVCSRRSERRIEDDRYGQARRVLLAYEQLQCFSCLPFACQGTRILRPNHRPRTWSSVPRWGCTSWRRLWCRQWPCGCRQMHWWWSLGHLRRR